MSGGHFDCDQYRIEAIADSISTVLEPENWEQYGFSAKTKERVVQGLLVIRRAATYANEIDYLLSGDTGEQSFLKRLEKELSEIRAEGKAL